MLNQLFFLKKIHNYLVDNYNGVLIYVITTLYMFALVSTQNNFKISLIVSMLYGVLVWVVSKNLLFAIFNTIFCTNLFLNLGKYQSIQIINSNDVTTMLYKGIYGIRNVIDYEYYKDGLFVSVGISTSVIFSVFAVILLSIRVITSIFENKKIIFEKLSTINTVILIIYLSFLLNVFYLSISSGRYSFIPLYSYTLLSRIAVGYIILLLTSLLIKTDAEKKILRYVVSAVVTVLLVVGFKQLFSFSHPTILEEFSTVVEKQSFFVRPQGIFGHANPYSLILATLLLFQLFQTKKNILEKVTIASSSVMLVFTQTRSIWLGFIIIILSIFNKQIWKIINIVLLNGSRLSVKILAVVLLAVLLQRVVSTSYSFNSDGGMYLRKQMVGDAITLIMNKPLFGYGLGNDVLATLDLLPSSNTRYYPYSVHNALIQFILESGLIGLLLQISVPTVIVLDLLLNKNTKNNEALLLLSVIIVYLCYYLFQPSNTNRIEYGLFGFVVGWYIASKNNSK